MEVQVTTFDLWQRNRIVKLARGQAEPLWLGPSRPLRIISDMPGSDPHAARRDDRHERHPQSICRLI